MSSQAQEPSDKKEAGWVWMDGRVCPPEEATVSVMDRGFLYGDSIYESVRTHGGKFYALEDHLDRLFRSAESIELDLPWGREGITEILNYLLEQPICLFSISFCVSKGI